MVQPVQPTWCNHCGSQECRLARVAAHRAAHESMVQKYTSSEMKYDAPLTADQCEKIFRKATLLHETALEDRPAAKRPDEEIWRSYRMLVVHWTNSLAECCKTDLAPNVFRTLEDAC